MQQSALLRTMAAIFSVCLVVSACDSEVSTANDGTGGTTSSGTTSSGGGGSGATGGGGGTGGAPAGGGGAGGGAGGSAGAGGSGAVLCNPDDVACYGLPPDCAPGEVPSVEDACWGPCVPILSCQPQPSCGACQTGMCAEYVAWTVEYRCVLPPLQCSALACSCLAPYFCVESFNACSMPGPGDVDVTCSCPTC